MGKFWIFLLGWKEFTNLFEILENNIKFLCKYIVLGEVGQRFSERFFVIFDDVGTKGVIRIREKKNRFMFFAHISLCIRWKHRNLCIR